MTKRRTPINYAIRDRTLVIGSAKGGVNKTTIAAKLAYEMTRFGLRVVCIDVDGTGGFSSLMGSYAPPGYPSVVDVLEGRVAPSDALYKVSTWTAPVDSPWTHGGAALPGGSLHLIPSAQQSEGRETVSDVVSQAGTSKEARLGNILRDPVFEKFDIIILDMPGTDNASVVNTLLGAAGHVAFAAHPSQFGFEGMVGLDALIGQWLNAMPHLDINYLGGIPTSIPVPVKRNAAYRTVMGQYLNWLHDTAEDLHLLAPGIEFRGSINDAALKAAPVQQETRLSVGMRDAGTIPPALTRTALTILEQMNGGVDGDALYDTEAITRAVLDQEMPDKWRNIIDGPRYLMEGDL